MTRGPMSPDTCNVLTDEQLAADGWATGLDVWEPVIKVYREAVANSVIANSQLWSLREAIRAELLDELATFNVGALRPLGDRLLKTMEKRDGET